MSLNIPTTKAPRVVIIGGGFAGLELANKLHGQNFQVVILEKQLPPISTTSLSSSNRRTRAKLNCISF